LLKQTLMVQVQVVALSLVLLLLEHSWLLDDAREVIPHGELDSQVQNRRPLLTEGVQ